MKFVFSSLYRQAMRHGGAWSSRDMGGHARWIHGEHSNVSMRQSPPPGAMAATLKGIIPPANARRDRPQDRA